MALLTQGKTRQPYWYTRDRLIDTSSRQIFLSISSASQERHTYGHTDSPEDLLGHPRSYWGIRVLSSAFPQRTDLRSNFPQQVNKATPTGILTHLRTYWDNQGPTEACGYFPQHFLSAGRWRRRRGDVFLCGYFRQFRTQIWHFVRKQDGLTFI